MEQRHHKWNDDIINETMTVIMRRRWLFVNRESIAHIVSTTHTQSTTPHTHERTNEREGVLANVSFLYSVLDSIYIIYLVPVLKEGKFSFNHLKRFQQKLSK